MASEEPSSNTNTVNSAGIHGKGRGRGRTTRGGLGKYLRARGRARGGSGRPAEFHKRLLLEGEGESELEDEEAQELKEELARKYGRRQLQSNTDRYVEDEPELGSDGEPVVMPEVDITAFLEKQRHSEDTGSLSKVDEDDDVDHTLAHLSIKGSSAATVSRKGKIQQIEWDEEFETMKQEKERSQANRDLKSRLRENTSKLRTRGFAADRGISRGAHKVVEAPPLPLSKGAIPLPSSDSKAAMEDFLDDLLV